MSKRIDPEIDELIWAAADSDDPEVRADFERRFPDHRAELSTRRVMVEVFRQSKPDAPNDPRLHFSPPTQSAPAWRRRLVLVPVACLALAALAFGAFQVTKMFVGQPEAARQENASPASGPTKQVPPVGGPSMAEGVIPPDGSSSAKQGEDRRGVGERPIEPAPSELQVRLQGTMTLYGALNSVAQQAKVKVDILPGVPDAQIHLTSGGPTETFSLSVPDAIKLIEQVAHVKIMDNGPGNYMVFPVEKGGSTAPGGVPPHSAGG
jgi:hypothetical protein